MDLGAGEPPQHLERRRQIELRERRKEQHPDLEGHGVRTFSCPRRTPRSANVSTVLGFMSKRVETLELWKVRDVELCQSLVDRMFGVSSLVVTAHGNATPALEIKGLPGSRAVYDRLMTAVMNVRPQRGVMNLNQ
ncbi:MAG: PH domain-containing protein [Polyangiaceae bacterium]